MLSSTIRFAPIAILLVACGGAETTPVQAPPPPPSSVAPPAAAPAPKPGAETLTSTRKLEAETPITTPAGATFTAPKGWSLTERSGALVLEDPNKEVSLTFVERKEPDGAAAIAAAWKQVDAGFSRKIRIATTPPGRLGWDAVANINYETTAAELRGVW